MTREELDRVYADMAWQIAKRSSVQAVKSLLIGGEKLDRMIARIDDAYRLDEADRRRLRPTKTVDVTDHVTDGADRLRTLTGVGVGALEGGKMVQMAKQAHRGGRLLKTARTLALSGTKAAGQVARTGKTAIKANPVALAIQAAYTVGTTGWFALQAERHNRACYALIESRLAHTETTAAG